MRLRPRSDTRSRCRPTLPQLVVADAVVLVHLHRHAATRASIAIAGNDIRFALPTFRLVMLLPRRSCGLRTIEPLRRPVVLEQFRFVRDVAHAAIRHASLSISATPIHPSLRHQCTRSRVRSPYLLRLSSSGPSDREDVQRDLTDPLF
jgi:hypothetical protein